MAEEKENSKKPWVPPYTETEENQIQAWRIQASQGNVHAQHLLQNVQALAMVAEQEKREEEKLEAQESVFDISKLLIYGFVALFLILIIFKFLKK